MTPELAKLQGIALAGVFQILISEAGRRTREGQSQDQIADGLRPAIEAILDDLDPWLTPGYGPRTAETARRRYPLRHLSHLADLGRQKALPKANHRKGPPSATAAAVAVADLRRLARAGRGVSSALRRKLGDRAGSLQTVRGAGDRFIAPPAGCLVSAAT